MEERVSVNVAVDGFLVGLVLHAFLLGDYPDSNIGEAQIWASGMKAMEAQEESKKKIIRNLEGAANVQ